MFIHEYGYQGSVICNTVVSFKGRSLESTHLLKGHTFLAASIMSTSCEYMWCSLLPKDTSLIRTECFGRRGLSLSMLHVLGGLLYACGPQLCCSHFSVSCSLNCTMQDKCSYLLCLGDLYIMKHFNIYH